MKILQFTLIIIILSVSIASTVQARSDRRLKVLLQQRNDAKEAEAITQEADLRLDVPYVDDNDPSHKLDIYFPPRKNKSLPVLVHIHGGGWRRGDKIMMKATGMFYASKGIVFITPNYRLTPKVSHPAHMEDCAAALAWVFNHIGELSGDKGRVFLSGHSAGGHLAALLATNRKYLQKFSINPGDLAGVIPIDTASFDLLSDDNENLVKRLVKQAFGIDRQVLTEASPFHNVTNRASYPDFLILNTTNREFAAKGGKAFAEKLKSTGSNARFVPVDNHTHKEMAEGMYDASDPVSGAILKYILQ